MKRQALALAATVSLAVTGAIACTAKVEEGSKETAKVDVRESTKALTHEGRRHQHLHGPLRIVLQAARADASLSDAQLESLAAIESDLKRERAGRKALRERLKRSAVAVVRAGNADSPEFDASVKEAISAFKERADQHADALEEIHGVLTPAQRSAVAIKLRAHVAEQLGAPRDTKRREEGFKRFANELMLSTLQVEKLRTMKTELLGETQRLRPTAEEAYALIDAFEGDDFRTALNAYRAKKLAILEKRVESAGQRTNSVLSIFTAEQRTLIADLILEGPKKVLLGEPGAR